MVTKDIDEVLNALNSHKNKIEAMQETVEDLKSKLESRIEKENEEDANRGNSIIAADVEEVRKRLDEVEKELRAENEAIGVKEALDDLKEKIDITEKRVASSFDDINKLKDQLNKHEELLKSSINEPQEIKEQLKALPGKDAVEELRQKCDNIEKTMGEYKEASRDLKNDLDDNKVRLEEMIEDTENRLKEVIESGIETVSYTHLTLPTTPYV
eukprot:TRINITY_DN6952_c0_g1_i1.p2 TRINITY_DN6952_c0_g1~~TRINITY_DN6952_c0_g1_i1.p2  ORF type:complete len:213 (-),score=83.75 TRINITY_DN6952_c0_g1_i1:43-681(-)